MCDGVKKLQKNYIILLWVYSCAGYTQVGKYFFFILVSRSNSSQCFLTFPNHLCGCKENYFIASLLLIHLYGDHTRGRDASHLTHTDKNSVHQITPDVYVFYDDESFFVWYVSEGPNPSKVVVILCANTRLDSLQIICWEFLYAAAAAIKWLHIFFISPPPARIRRRAIKGIFMA